MPFMVAGLCFLASATFERPLSGHITRGAENICSQKVPEQSGPMGVGRGQQTRQPWGWLSQMVPGRASAWGQCGYHGISENSRSGLTLP